jgi:solute carrier family 25 (mitochondrial 2-oxodicarboxylate transporter), member 21
VRLESYSCNTTTRSSNTFATTTARGKRAPEAVTNKETSRSFSRLYRGITAPILMEAPKRATKFAANDEWGKFYRKAFGAEKMTQPLSVLTGATAGATESFVVVPFELVKIRLQDKANASKYNGMLDVVAKTVRQEGILAMYQGLESTMWRHILWNAGYFGCIFQVRQLLPKAKDKSAQMANDIVAGTVGGTIGTVLNTPLDVVKSRIQNAVKVPGVTPKYNWAFPAVGTVLKEEGFAALYKGFLPKVLRLGPVSSPAAEPPQEAKKKSKNPGLADTEETGRWYPSRGLPGRHRLLQEASKGLDIGRA